MLKTKLGLQGLGVVPAIDEVRAVYPWARSVVVAAVCYLPPECTVQDDVPRGLVARVARGADYHTVLRAKLDRIAHAICKEHPGARTEVCVDTCRLPERKLGVLARMAWRGKNGNVFVEGCGSYAALGEVVTDVELPVSDSTLSDRCGSCDICARACPASAITEPYLVDRGKCISQLTQMSGVVPRELRPLIGNRIYGCDVCQEVCPQNEGITSGGDSEFAEDTWPGACPELIPLLRMTAEEFKQNVQKSSIGWIRRTRIRRNAAIAAGNLKCEEALPALVEMLRDENPILRIHAAWALGEIGSAFALQALGEARSSEEDPDVLQEIEASLAK